jgi:hypothetical protein
LSRDSENIITADIEGSLTLAELTRYPCVACGFLTFTRGAGSKERCFVCEWQDDGIQLAHPGMVGGLNGLSLWDWQQRVLHDYPPPLQELPGVRRSPQWRPLFEEEAASRRGVRISGRMYQEGTSGKYYWT